VQVHPRTHGQSTASQLGLFWPAGLRQIPIPEGHAAIAGCYYRLQGAGRPPALCLYAQAAGAFGRHRAQRTELVPAPIRATAGDPSGSRIVFLMPIGRALAVELPVELLAAWFALYMVLLLPLRLRWLPLLLLLQPGNWKAERRSSNKQATPLVFILHALHTAYCVLCTT
jgi:hypothetical protein